MGLVLSAAALLATLPSTRPLAARAIVGWLDDAVEGTIELGGIGVVAGGIELRALRVRDPEGREVVAIGRARLFADATRLGARALTLALEIEGLDADASLRAEDGSLAIARAFAPTRAVRREPRGGEAPTGAGSPAPATPQREGSGWTVRVSRVTVASARLRLPGPGLAPIELRDLALEARGSVGPRDAVVELSARAILAAPGSPPASLALCASRDGDRVELLRLEARLGVDRLEALGEGNLAQRTGRFAITRLGLSAADAGSFVPGARLAGELSGTLYAEADGRVATVALAVTPASAEATGRGALAAAVALPPRPFAWGLSVDLDRLDPSRLTLLAPAGSVTLLGSGGARGSRLGELAGRIDLALEPSRLRGGSFGPARLTARAGGGFIEVPRLLLAAPGGAVAGKLHWRQGAPVSGELGVSLDELERFTRNLGELVGRRLPPLEGRARAAVTLAGTSREPRLDATVEAPWLVAGGVRAERATLALRLDGGEGSLALGATVPSLGTDPFRLELTGRLGAGRRALELGTLLIAWPGSLFALLQPARVDLEAPAVDRLALGSGDQRIDVEGGVERGGALAGRVRVTGFDLGRLPRGLLPAGAGLAGVLTLDARVSGQRAAPRVDATVGLAGGELLGVGGLSVLGDVGWDGGSNRAEADLELVRARGGAIALSFDLPLPLSRSRGAKEELRLELTARAVPVDELTWLAGSYALASGALEGSAVLAGTVGAPTFRASARLRDGTWEELEEFELEATLEAPGERVQVGAAGKLDGRKVATLEGAARLELSRLLTAPAEALGALRSGAASLEGRILDLELRRLAGWLGLPGDLAGRLAGEVKLGGRPTAPRGTVRIGLDGGAGWGARSVGGSVELALADERTGGTATLTFGGQEAARLDGRLDLAAERIRDRGALASAPVQLDLRLHGSDLSGWGGERIALRGSLEASGMLRGTPGAPRAELKLAATGAAIEGRPLGDLDLSGSYVARRSHAIANLRPAAGGGLRLEGSLLHPFGLDAEGGTLRDAQVELRAVAEALDLGVLPALLPGLVRSAGGAVTLDLAAVGPLRSLRPRGSLHISKGKVAIAELGEWTRAQVDADLGDDAVELRRFDVEKGEGKLSLKGSVRGLARAGPAEVEARFTATDFGVERSGIEFVKLTVKAEGRGKLDRDHLALAIVLPETEVRLPRRIPRSLQETSARKDIAVGRPAPARRPRAAPGPDARAAGEPAVEAPFRTVLHVVAPRRLHVRADQPRIDVELKGDTLLAFAGGRQEATGSIEVIRGQLEPIGGRVFELERGKATFSGGPIVAGALDLAARWDAPMAVVRATVGGTIARPSLQLASEPPLGESQIALLLATGRTEAKVGTGGVNTLAAGDAGLAAAGALAMGVFKDLLSNKLPIDSVSLDSTAVTAGKYLTDRIYLGYVRRFDAKPEKGENPDEVRVEYQLAPGWQVETRYGSGQAGGASIVWTKSY